MTYFFRSTCNELKEDFMSYLPQEKKLASMKCISELFSLSVVAYIVFNIFQKINWKWNNTEGVFNRGSTAVLQGA